MRSSEARSLTGRSAQATDGEARSLMHDKMVAIKRRLILQPGYLRLESGCILFRLKQACMPWIFWDGVVDA
jgi:hypothetical protein